LFKTGEVLKGAMAVESELAEDGLGLFPGYNSLSELVMPFQVVFD
jgi:hypothetical protein